MSEHTIVITGASGQFGRALVATLGTRPGWRVRPLGHQDIEITDRASIARALEPPPDVLINTAVWHGPRQEDAEMALRANALGPRLLAEFCAARGTLLVHISTDYVFDGEATAPYRETDRAEPRSVYGISKLAGEQLVRAATSRHLIVRVSSLYDIGGSRAKGGTSFASIMLDKARRDEPIRVVADQIHSPTYAPDAAVTMAQLVEAGVTGTAHVSNTGWCSWYEFAVKLFHLAGLQADVTPIRLADLPPQPPRPRYSVLAHEALRAAGIPSPRPWPDALRDFLARAGYAAGHPLSSRAGEVTGR